MALRLFELCFGVGLIIAVFDIIRMNRKASSLLEAVQNEFVQSGETVLRGPAPGIYKGATGILDVARGNAVFVLTDTRLLIRKITRSAVEIPITEIRSVKLSKWFKSWYYGNQGFVVVETTSNKKIGFLVPTPSA